MGFRFNDAFAARAMGLLDALTAIPKALIFGTRYNRTTAVMVDASDSVYGVYSLQEYLQAVEIAHGVMNREGWVLDNWKIKQLDCEDYAMKLKVEIIKALSDMFPEREGKGIPVGIFGYTRDSDHAGHVLVICVDKTGLADKSFYFDVFPEEKYRKPKVLTKTEIGTCELQLF